MDRKETKEAISIMQHYADGGDVEHWEAGEWVLVSAPSWAWSETDYRIKPSSKNLARTH